MDHRVGKARALKSDEDAAHRLRMTQAEKAAGVERVVHGLGGDAARQVVEIDQQVAAEDDVDVAEGARVARSVRFTRVNSTAATRSREISYSYSPCAAEVLLQVGLRQLATERCE
jgi:hypothetical protein